MRKFTFYVSTMLFHFQKIISKFTIMVNVSVRDSNVCFEYRVHAMEIYIICAVFYRKATKA